MQFPGMDPSLRVERPALQLGWAVALVFIAWLIAAFWLFGNAVEPLIDFSGDPVSADEQARSDRYMRIWAIVMAAGPAAMAILAGCFRMTKTAATFGIVTMVLTCLVAAQPWAVSRKAKDVRVVAEPTDEGFGRSFVVADPDAV